MIVPDRLSTVVKVGGSLLDWPELPVRLSDFINTELGGSNRRVLIAGGGRTVDVVRDLDRIHRFGEVGAHLLALDALDLTARILARLLPEGRVVVAVEEIQACWNAGVAPILSTGRVIQRLEPGSAEPLPATWEATSDSIAAWLAARFQADRLVLLKSIDAPPGTSRAGASKVGFVDPLFATAARSLKRVEYRNLRDRAGRLVELLSEDPTRRDSHRVVS